MMSGNRIDEHSEPLGSGGLSEVLSDAFVAMCESVHERVKDGDPPEVIEAQVKYIIRSQAYIQTYALAFVLGNPDRTKLDWAMFSEKAVEDTAKAMADLPSEGGG